MPQLDANTFIFQYTTIIIVLATIYCVLSYLVLPQILRALIIRNNITRNNSANKIAASTKFLALDKLISRKGLFSLLSRNVANISDKKIALTNTYFSSNDSYVDYLALLLIEDEKEYTND